MHLRRLDPAADAALFALTFEWREAAPLWWRQADEAFGRRDFFDIYAAARDPRQADFGVFEGGALVGVVTLTARGGGTFEADLGARPRTDPTLLARAGYRLREELFRNGAAEIFVWVARVNRGVRRIARAAGLSEDGVTAYRGAARGRAVEWVRLSCTRSRWGAEVEERGQETDLHQHDDEHERVRRAA